MPYSIVVIAGPTASGKTALAVKFCEKINGEIISADSRQVYRGMDIGSGKDISEYSTDTGKINYHLIDIVEPNIKYSLYNYLHDFSQAYSSIVAKNRIPVICGGTGLYIEAVLKRYNVSSVPENVKFREKMMLKNREELLQILSSHPNLQSKTDINSKKRIVRALEIAEFQNQVSEDDYNLPEITNPLIAVIMMDTEELKNRITSRLNQRLNEGMVDEVKRLMDSGISYDRLLMFGMEYKYIAQFLNRILQFDEMKQILEKEIFRLAKRQRTYFRGMKRRGLPVHFISKPDLNQLLTLYNAS
jgi:tRNA dimethylallyltransferase